MNDVIEWTNKNSGFLTLIIFVASLAIGWISGAYKLIKKRPKFRIRIIQDHSFGCVIDLNRSHNNLPVHKTAFLLYLEVANIGNAPSTIGKINLGYLLSDTKPKWLTNLNWIPETISKSDFSISLGDSELVKVLPFLKQRSMLTNSSSDTYLEIGKSVVGTVYFEEQEAYGSWMPRQNRDNTTDLKLTIKDAFCKSHKLKFKLSLIELEEALKASPYFAQTYKEYFLKKEEN